MVAETPTALLRDEYGGGDQDASDQRSLNGRSCGSGRLVRLTTDGELSRFMPEGIAMHASHVRPHRPSEP
jgi:hypothetical protein